MRLGQLLRRQLAPQIDGVRAASYPADLVHGVAQPPKQEDSLGTLRLLLRGMDHANRAPVAPALAITLFARITVAIAPPPARATEATASAHMTSTAAAMGNGDAAVQRQEMSQLVLLLVLLLLFAVALLLLCPEGLLPSSPPLGPAGSTVLPCLVLPRPLRPFLALLLPAIVPARLRRRRRRRCVRRSSRAVAAAPVRLLCRP